MKANESELPDIAKILGRALQTIEPGERPAVLAALERLAAGRYRKWADEHQDPQVKEGLLACAHREEEIARRVESLHADAAGIQDKLLALNPELLDLNRTLFEGRPIKEQFMIQAQGERAGAAAWRAFAAAASEPSARELLQSCSALEETNAAFLDSLL